jgi:hypothetical protein
MFEENMIVVIESTVAAREQEGQDWYVWWMCSAVRDGGY